MLKKRTITALIGLPVLLAAVWFNSPVPLFTILVAVWGGVAAAEFYRLCGVSGKRPLAYFGTTWTVLLIVARDADVLALLGPRLQYGPLTVLLLTAATVLPLLWLLRRGSGGEAFAAWAWTLAGMAYIGILLGHFVALRALDEGRNWVYFALLATFASDTAALFVGRAWGRRKMAPWISPAKTWAGAVGGLSGAALISLIFLPDTLFSAANPVHIPDLQYWSAVLLGVVVSVFGQLGDLMESLFKRNMGAKDSGRLLPGHGGALDRVDSVALAGVVVYYFVWML